MQVSSFTFVDLYRRVLETAAHLLSKGADHLQGQGDDPESMLDWRLAEDMQPLRFQLMVVANFAVQWPARFAGSPLPEPIGVDLTIAEFLEALRAAKEGLAALDPAEFAGRDEVPITYRIMEGLEPTMAAGQWLAVFATTNIYFHLSTAYGILRANGVPLGKPDLFASGL